MIAQSAHKVVGVGSAMLAMSAMTSSARLVKMQFTMGRATETCAVYQRKRTYEQVEKERREQLYVQASG